MADHQFQAGGSGHVTLGLNVGFTLHQFSQIFRLRDAAGAPYLLIGGQAVNYWAERYAAKEPELAALRPFTSEDIDFKGVAADVARIAAQLNLRPGYPASVQMTALAGVILLACKLELAASVPQQHRRDVSHLKILLPCVRAFLTEFLEQVDAEQIPAKHWLGAANQVLKLTTNKRARKIGAKHQIDWSEIMPLVAIARSSQEKIQRFKEQQLEMGFKKSESE